MTFDKFNCESARKLALEDRLQAIRLVNHKNRRRKIKHFIHQPSSLRTGKPRVLSLGYVPRAAASGRTVLRHLR